MTPSARIADHVVDEIRERAVVSEIVGRVVALKRHGREMMGLCPFHNERSPSFTVADGKGFYHCFGCGAHGDVFRFLMETQGLTFPEAIAEVGRTVGIDVAVDPLSGLQAGERADRLRALERRKGALSVLRALGAAAELKESLALARKIWIAAEDGPDLALGYFRSRGIVLQGLPRIMRAHRAMFHTPSNRSWPGIVTYLEGPYGFHGIHRTYLDPGKAGKAPVENAKMTLGSVFETGAAARLQTATARVALVEGLENALIFAAALRKAGGGGPPAWPVWSVLALHGFRSVALPESVTDVLIVPDADESPVPKDGRKSGRETAREIIEQAVARFQAQGRTVYRFDTPEGHDLDSMRQIPGEQLAVTA